MAPFDDREARVARGRGRRPKPTRARDAQRLEPRRRRGRAEDDLTNPATGRPFWDENAPARPPGTAPSLRPQFNPNRGGAEDDATNPLTGHPRWQDRPRYRSPGSPKRQRY